MIEPIKPGDELFPYDVEMLDGEKRITIKKDWSDEKAVALGLRTIEYFLQFQHKHGSVSLINMTRCGPLDITAANSARGFWTASASVHTFERDCFK